MLALGWLGVSGAIEQRDEMDSAGQIAQSLCQFAYGVLSLAAVFAAFRFRGWLARVLVAWLACLTLAGGLASVVWGGTSVAIGLLSGAGTFVVGWLIAWMLRAGVAGLAP
ncbi:MAG TPA: hypothetical protein VJN95_03150 [Gemmatimonadales bacterium]|nr:hypothetical protein [Gemmatimonadales bacterium]